jgi:hypothetical protein
VAEMARTSKDHGDAMLISCRNNFIIPHAATWLNGATCTAIHYDI